MATNNAPTSSADTTGAGRPALPRQLWQAPVFVVGMAALLGVWLGRPLAFFDNPQRHLEHDLAAARHLLTRPDGDARSAADHARRAFEAASGQFPDRAGEASFLLGSALMRLAERADRGHADEHWREAREHLEEAERLGVPEADRGRLTYRLGKVGYHTQENPGRVAERLALGAEQAEDRAEAYGLLTQAYLRLNPPDLLRALEANKKLRQVPLVGEDVLAPARLLGGELLLRLHQPAEARKVLDRVGEQAPADVVVKARVLRAQSFQEEHKWAEAATLYQAALADGRVPPGAPARVLFNLGLCYRLLDQPQEAERAWEECARRDRGPEGVAAAFGLADLRMQRSAPEKALDILAGAVQNIHKPSDWANPLADLAQARAVFERVADGCRKAQRFDLTLRLARLYQRLAAPPRAELLRAEAATEWARACREKARQAKTNDEQMEQEVKARELFAQAGAAYAEVAEQAQGPAERADALWQSAAQYLACQDFAGAAGRLEAFLRLGQQPDRQGEAFYLLGEAHRRSDHPAEAAAAYRECIKFPTPFAYRARYQLALAAIAAGDLDEAEAALSLNLKLLRFDPDPEALEKSLFALGDLLYQRRNYRMVVRRLEEALTRFQGEPGTPPSGGPPGPAAGQRPLTPEYTRARYQLADSYRQLAAQENQNYLIGDNMSGETRKHFLQEHRRWLLKAAEEFSHLDDLLQNPETQGHLRPEQQVRVPFIAARCWFNYGKYEKALKIYDDLARRYRKRPEGLEALGGTVSCYAALGQLEQVRSRLDDIRRELSGMNESVRRAWEAWIVEASKPLAVP